MIGKPDPVAKMIVKAFVSRSLATKAATNCARDSSCKRLGAAVAPREIEFVDAPGVTGAGDHAPAAEGAGVGLPGEGDTSTLEPEPEPEPER